MIDGAAQALVLSTQSMQFRSVSEPSGENNLRGSREGFVELLRVNISLVRRLVRTQTFMAETLTCGEKTQTELALLYDRKLVSQPLLAEIRRRASQAKLPFVFDTGYLAPFLQRGYFSFFQSVGYTERPDTAAAKICEGKIVLMANGSPFAMLIPYFSVKIFQHGRLFGKSLFCHAGALPEVCCISDSGDASGGVCQHCKFHTRTFAQRDAI